MREAEGDLAGALDLFDEAERIYTSDYFPNTRPAAAMRARVDVARGEFAAAITWARDRQLSFDDELSYLLEFEHITLAWVLVARYADDHANRSVNEATALSPGS